MATKAKALSEAQRKRIEKALAKVSLSPDLYPDMILDALELAACKYDAAIIPADADHWRSECAKLAAILLA
jgi:hypothetical protein